MYNICINNICLSQYLLQIYNKIFKTKLILPHKKDYKNRNIN